MNREHITSLEHNVLYAKCREYRVWFAKIQNSRVNMERYKALRVDAIVLASKVFKLYKW